MNSLIVMFKKELLEIYRSKKLLILIILFAFIAISSPILAKLLPTILKSMPETPGLTIAIPDPTWRDAIDQLVKNIAQIGMIVIIIMFAGSIADEKSKKTLELVLTKPVSRAKFILAKFLGSLFATKVVFLASMAVFYLYTITILGSFNLVNFLWLAIFLLIYIALILSLTLFFSTISKSQIMAVGLAFFTEIILSIIVGYIKKLADYSPDYIVANYKDLVIDNKVMPFVTPSLISLAAIILLIIASILIFQRQEVER